ncbi:MAG: hypothetical protein FK733_00900 [Asgard group archaeon]|nr:hypothetical protein [Asgard group archaeon]
MNDKLTEQTIIIKNFIDDVRKKLPYRMKSQRKDVNDIIEELEEHIWDKANELAQGQDPSVDQIFFVISQMGSPREIAKEYRHRGKPKIFITDELFSWYWKTLAVAGALTFVVILLSALLSIKVNTPLEITKNFFIWLSLGLLVVFNLISIIFVVLSMQGYLPEDFKRITKPGSKDIVVDSQSIDLQPHDTKQTQRASRIRFNYFRRQEFLIGGIVGIIISILMLTLPNIAFRPLMSTYYMLPLINWLAMIGTILFVANGIRFIQALVGYRERFQQILMVIHCIPIAILVPFFIAFYGQNEIIVNILADLLPGIEVNLMTIIFSGCIFLTILVILVMNVIRVIMIGVKGFPSQRGNYQ